MLPATSTHGGRRRRRPDLQVDVRPRCVVRDAESASRNERLRNDAVSLGHPRRECHHRADGVLHQLRIKDLRADVRVVPDKPHRVGNRDPPRRLIGLPVPHRKSELRIGRPRAHLGVGVRIDPRVQAQRHIDALPLLPRDGGEQRDLQVIVDGNQPDPGRYRLDQLPATLVVAVEHHLSRIDAGRQSRVNLPAGHHVEPQPFFGQDPH